MRHLLTVIATTTVLSGSLVGASAADAATRHGDHASARPATEHVSDAVHRVALRYSNGTVTTPTSSSGGGGGATVHGAKATKLVDLFNALKREPRGTIHCDVAGGPQTTVTFHGPHHTWVAKQAACTNVLVTRDGKALPTLLPSKAWTAAVNHDLGR
ncbi:MAG TPA: hypothetical protein VHV76_03685 [Mycobacteriales bacterium]|jgi:hypothetical protein|nr:hypothetical protein [Mycobacteriales bacterium]